MAKESTNPKPSVQIECCCLAVYKYMYTCEHTFEYMGAEKQTAKKVGFCHLPFYFLIQTKAVIELFMHRTTSLSP